MLSTPSLKHDTRTLCVIATPNLSRAISSSTYSIFATGSPAFTPIPRSVILDHDSDVNRDNRFCSNRLCSWPSFYRCAVPSLSSSHNKMTVHPELISSQPRRPSVQISYNVKFDGLMPLTNVRIDLGIYNWTKVNPRRGFSLRETLYLLYSCYTFCRMGSYFTLVRDKHQSSVTFHCLQHQRVAHILSLLTGHVRHSKVRCYAPIFPIPERALRSIISDPLIQAVCEIYHPTLLRKEIELSFKRYYRDMVPQSRFSYWRNAFNCARGHVTNYLTQTVVGGITTYIVSACKSNAWTILKETILHMVRTLKDKLKSIYDFVVTNVKELIEFLATLVHIIMRCFSGFKDSLKGLIDKAFWYFRTDYVDDDDVRDAFASGLHPQSDDQEEDTSLWSTAVKAFTMISTVVTETCMDVVTSMMQVDAASIRDRTVSFLKSFGSLATGFDKLCSVSMKIIDWLWLFFFGSPLSKGGKLNHRISSFVKEAGEIQEYFTTLRPGVPLSQDVMDALVRLRTEQNEISLELISADLAPSQRTFYVQTHQQVGKHLEACELLCKQWVPKPSPVVVILHGPPRVGKSDFARDIPILVLQYIAKFCDHFNLPNPFGSIAKEAVSRLYSGTVFPKHFDGYQNQFSIVVEELFTSKIVQHNVDWGSALFVWANSFASPLEMAFGDKGKTFMTSELIIATTNFAGHKVCIEDPDAWYRRIDFDLTCGSRFFNGSTHLTGIDFEFTPDALPRRGFGAKYPLDAAVDWLPDKFDSPQLVEAIGLLLLKRKYAALNFKPPDLSKLPKYSFLFDPDIVPPESSSSSDSSDFGDQADDNYNPFELPLGDDDPVRLATDIALGKKYVSKTMSTIDMSRASSMVNSQVAKLHVRRERVEPQGFFSFLDPPLDFEQRERVVQANKYYQKHATSFAKNLWKIDSLEWAKPFYNDSFGPEPHYWSYRNIKPPSSKLFSLLGASVNATGISFYDVNGQMRLLHDKPHGAHNNQLKKNFTAFEIAMAADFLELLFPRSWLLENPADAELLIFMTLLPASGRIKKREPDSYSTGSFVDIAEASSGSNIQEALGLFHLEANTLDFYLALNGIYKHVYTTKNCTTDNNALYLFPFSPGVAPLRLFLKNHPEYSHVMRVDNYLGFESFSLGFTRLVGVISQSATDCSAINTYLSLEIFEDVYYAHANQHLAWIMSQHPLTPLMVCNARRYTLGVKIAASAIAVTSCIAIGAALIAKIYPEEMYDPHYANAPVRSTKTTARANVLKKVLDSKPIIVQPQMRNNARIISKVAGNTYFIITQEGTVNVPAYVLFLRGTIAVMNKHVWDALPHSFKIATMDGNRHLAFTRTKVTLLYTHPSRDTVFLDFRTTFCHPRIEKFLLSETHFENYWSTPIGGFRYSPEVVSTPDGSEFKDSWLQTDVIVNGVTKLVFAEKKNKHMADYHYLMTNGRAAAGDCGSPYVGELMHKDILFGIHSAGNGDGFGPCCIAPVTLEDYNNAVAHLTQYSGLVAQMAYQQSDSMGLYKIHDVASIEGSVSVTPFNKTQFTPSPLHAAPLSNAPIGKKPASLSREAYFKARAKGSTMTNCNSIDERVHDFLHENHRELALNMNVVPRMQRRRNLRFLTPYQAIWGDEIAGIPSIDFSTSRGLTLKSAGISKKRAQDPDSPDGQALLALVTTRWNELCSGKYRACISFDCLKDELRPLDRVAEKKTRLFYVVDFVDNINLRQILYPVMASFGDTFGLHAHMCGINPTSGSWRWLRRYFQSYDTVVCADVSGWDFLGSPVLAPFLSYYLSLFYINTSYIGSTAHELLTWAVSAYFHCLRFTKKDLQSFTSTPNRDTAFPRASCAYWLGHGGPSGGIFTTFFNTLIHDVMKCVCFVFNFVDHDEGDVREGILALRTFRRVIYSDDNISASHYPWWTINAYAFYVKKYFYGDITATDKSLNFISGGIMTSDFLSRTFYDDDGVLSCPLSLESVVAQLYYVRRAKDGTSTTDHLYTQLAINVENVCRELRQYPASYSEPLLDALEESLVALGLSIPVHRYTTQENRDFRNFF